MTSLPVDSRRGSVLFLALVIIAVLMALTVESLRTMQVDLTDALNYRNRRQAEALCDTAVSLLASRLAEDARENDGDSLLEPWAALFPDPESPSVGALDFASGSVAGVVSDECGRFPVSALVDADGKPSPAHRDAFIRLLTGEPFLLSGEDAAGLADEITDWIDADDEPQPGLPPGAETPAVLDGVTLPPPNRPLASLAELTLLPGMTPELLYGDDETVGLSSLLTTFCAETVNINTAPPEVLMALTTDGMDRTRAEEFARDVIAFRENPRNVDALGSPTWYKDDMAGYNQQGLLRDDLIAVDSDRFRIEATARAGDGARSIAAVLARTVSGEGEEKKVEMSLAWRELR